MTKEVLIHIKGIQHMEGDQEGAEPLELITTGEYYFRNNTHFLLYDEVIEGFKEPTHNVLKFRPGYMEVRKRGTINVHMIFERDKKNVVYYETPFGKMEMEIFAKRVILAESAKVMELTADYVLGVNHSAMADCVMQIRVTQRGDKEGTTFFEL